MQLTIRRVKLDRMGYEASGYNKGRYWGVGLPLYYCPELEELRSTTPIRGCNEPHARAHSLEAARELFKRRIAETQSLPTRDELASRRLAWRG